MNERVIDTFRMMTLTGKAAVLLVLVATIITIWSSLGLISTLFGPSFTAQQAIAPDPSDAAKYLASIDADHQFIDRKSSFFKPKAPDETNDISDTGDNTPPPAHTIYAGPKLMGLSGITAYFDQPVLNSESSIKIGEAGGTVELVRIIPPFKAVVKWQEKNWTLDLMDTKFSFTTTPGGLEQPLALRSTGVSGVSPLTTRGSSPNTNVIFGDAITTRPASSGSVPARRPPQNNR